MDKVKRWKYTMYILSNPEAFLYRLMSWARVWNRWGTACPFNFFAVITDLLILKPFLTKSQGWRKEFSKRYFPFALMHAYIKLENDIISFNPISAFLAMLHWPAALDPLCSDSKQWIDSSRILAAFLRESWNSSMDISFIWSRLLARITKGVCSSNSTSPRHWK